MSSSRGRRPRWAAMASDPVLGERAGVAQVVDVLAGRAATTSVSALDGVGPGSVERGRPAFEQLGQIGPHRLEVDDVRASGSRRRRTSAAMEASRSPVATTVPASGRERHDGAGHRCPDHMLHLHRLDDHHAPRQPSGRRRDRDRHDGSLQRRRHPSRGSSGSGPGRSRRHGEDARLAGHRGHRRITFGVGHRGGTLGGGQRQGQERRVARGADGMHARSGEGEAPRRGSPGPAVV